MSVFALLDLPNGDAALVIRSHDLSGTDYERICVVDRRTARKLAEDGMAGARTDVRTSTNAVSVSPIDADRHVVEIVDGGEVVVSAEADSRSVHVALADGPHRVRWIVEPRA